MLKKLKNFATKGRAQGDKNGAESKNEDDAMMQMAIQASLIDQSGTGFHPDLPLPHLPSSGAWVPGIMESPMPGNSQPTGFPTNAMSDEDLARQLEDQELARKLQEEDEMGIPPNPSPSQLSDAELARRLQEEDMKAGNGFRPNEDTSADEELAKKLQAEDAQQMFWGATGNTQEPMSNICGACQQRVTSQYFKGAGVLYHPQCFVCGGCGGRIDTPSFRQHDGKIYHPQCALELFNPRCVICENIIPTNAHGQVSFIKHPFFEEKACPHHKDQAARCCSCQRFEPQGKGKAFAQLADGRKICMACCRTIVIDSDEARPIYDDILIWFQTELGLPIPPQMQQIPILLVDEPTLNDRSNRVGHSSVAGVPTTRGLTLSEEGTIQHMGRGVMMFDPFTGLMQQGPMQIFNLGMVREVTAILVLAGLPYDLCSSILAHESFHAWLRCQNDFPHLPLQVEEGMCQLIAQLWLRHNKEKKIIQRADSDGTRTEEGPSNADLRNLFIFQVETNDSEVYGEGFRLAARAFAELGLQPLIDHLKQYQSFPILD